MKFDKIMSCLPYFCRGLVVKGFGRGSKELGIPTANFPEAVVEKLPKDLPTGIYFGWAQVDNGAIHKMVMSIGWNPYYKNTVKSMETHIIHDFGRDFYGSCLNIVILGFIRPELNFESLERLIETIHNDIKVATDKLQTGEMEAFKHDNFFTNNNSENVEKVLQNGGGKVSNGTTEKQTQSNENKNKL